MSQISVLNINPIQDTAKKADGNNLNGFSDGNTWLPHDVTLDDGKKVTVLLHQDYAGEVINVLPLAPNIVYTREGSPLLSISLILGRFPAANQDNIHPLIEGCVLTFDLKLGVDSNVLHALTSNRKKNFKALFTREVTYHLEWLENNTKTCLSKSVSNGSEARTSVSVHLNRAQTLDVLKALDNTPSRLFISSKIQYRSTDSPKVIRLSGSWASIHKFLSSRLDKEGKLSEAMLQQNIASMVKDGLLTITLSDGSSTVLSPDVLLNLFTRQAGIILIKEYSLNNETYYTLRSSPLENVKLSYTESITSSILKSYELNTSLDHILNGVLRGRSWDDHVRIIAPNPSDPALLAPVPRRMPAEQNERSNVKDSGTNKLAAIGNTVTSLSVVSLPSNSVPAVIKPNITLVDNFIFNDIKLQLPGKDELQSLPIIVDKNAPYWTDMLNNKKVWYAPEFKVVQPEPGVEANRSPFLFTYKRTGVTGGNPPVPALEGTIRITLQKTMKESTREALRKALIVNASSVKIKMISVYLLIPFVDEKDSVVKQHVFTTVVQNNEDSIVVDVQLTNNWVRLAYGSLAKEGFQRLPLQVKIAYTFTGYVIIGEKDIELSYGGKAIYTQIVYSQAEATKLHLSNYFDATTLTYVQPQAKFRYQLEDLRENSQLDRNLNSTINTGLIKSKPVITPVVGIKPEITILPNLENILKKVNYATRTQMFQQVHPVLFKCNLFGHLYQQINEGQPSSAVGCQDEFTLGQISYQQYEEIVALKDSSYQVFRSLPQPGNFVVVPTSFCISRKEGGEPDAYRPLIFLHALIDVEVAANNIVELLTTLQPDIPKFKCIQLQEKLKAYHPRPLINYSIDIPNQSVSFTWLPNPFVSVTNDILDTTGPFIRVNFQMNLATWVITRSVLETTGINGSVSIRLADGTIFNSNLLLKLDHIRGPWERGPLEILLTSSEMRITNQIEQSIEIIDLVRYAGSGIAQQVPVEVTLKAGQTHTVNAQGNLEPVYNYPPGEVAGIQEIRSFVEEIYSKAAFVNLLNFANYNLVSLDIEVGVQGIAGRQTVQLTEALRTVEIPIILPLTIYLERRLLEFRVTKNFKNRNPETTEWKTWDMEMKGPVSITNELINL